MDFGSESVQNLLESSKPDGLVSALFITADHLFAHAKTRGELRLRNAMRNPNTRNESSYPVQAIQLRQFQFATFQGVVITNLCFALKDHCLAFSEKVCAAAGFVFAASTFSSAALRKSICAAAHWRSASLRIPFGSRGLR